MQWCYDVMVRVKLTYSRLDAPMRYNGLFHKWTLRIVKLLLLVSILGLTYGVFAFVGLHLAGVHAVSGWLGWLYGQAYLWRGSTDPWVVHPERAVRGHAVAGSIEVHAYLAHPAGVFAEGVVGPLFGIGHMYHGE